MCPAPSLCDRVLTVRACVCSCACSPAARLPARERAAVAGGRPLHRCQDAPAGTQPRRPQSEDGQPGRCAQSRPPGGGGSCRKRCIAGYSRLRLVSWQALAGNLALRGWCWDCRCLVRRSQQAHRTFHVAGIANVVVKAAAEDMKSNGLNSAGSEHAFNAQPYRWGGTALGEGSRVGLGRQGGVGGAGWGWVGRTQGPDAAVA